jgi:hypothetical protein
MWRRAVIGLAAAGVTLCLGSSAGAARVTWSFSGTSGGSPYTASVTYEASTLPTSPGSFDGAIVSATFESGSYAPAISVTPPDSSFIGLTSSFVTLFAGAPNGLESAQNPRFQLILGDVYVLDTSHLPIAPPSGTFSGAAFNLWTGGSGDVVDSFPISRISYSVPEPGIFALLLAAALGLVARLRSRVAT